MKFEHTFVVLAYKESKFLEECLKSVKNQSIPSKVVIATATPNTFIQSLAEKYDVEIIVNENHISIGYDFDFAVSVGKTALVTVAHQDDIYDYTYAEEMVEAYHKQPKSTIIFSDYYEIKHGNEKIYQNRNLMIKQILLFLLRFHGWANLGLIKRSALRFGDAICCPAVTFVKENVPDEIFASDLKCNVDWHAWEKLSRRKGYFYYVHKYLMGHRIYCESTTSEIIGENLRTKEDYEILKRFWPNAIAKIIAKAYAYSEKSNEE